MLKGIKSSILILNTLTFILFVFYVFHCNSIATIGYKLRDLNEDRDMLNSQQEILNLKISRIQSLNNLKNDPYITNMVSYPISLNYIKLDETSQKSNPL